MITEQPPLRRTFKSAFGSDHEYWNRLREHFPRGVWVSFTDLMTSTGLSRITVLRGLMHARCYGRVQERSVVLHYRKRERRASEYFYSSASK